MREIVLVAGEASGDLYGAALARAIRAIDGDVRFWGCGGDRMEAEGVELLYTTRRFAVLGFAEVAGRIPFFLRALSHMGDRIAARRPAAVVLIDFPGFNLRLARRCARSGVPVVYYVSPQVWAWGRKRIETVRRFVRLMLVILPFEEEIYRERGVPVRFVGHPLAEIARPRFGAGAFRARHQIDDQRPIVGLFPGSRIHEVERILPLLAETIARLARKGHAPCAVVGGAPTVPDRVYARILGEEGPPVLRDETYEILHASLFTLVASGTMTVEAACLGTPMAIVYRVSPLSWMIGKRLVRVPHIGMANLLAGERVVPEFVQHEATAERLTAQAEKWLADPALLVPIRQKLRRVREGLGGEGASRRAAEAVLDVAGKE